MQHVIFLSFSKNKKMAALSLPQSSPQTKTKKKLRGNLKTQLVYLYEDFKNCFSDDDRL